MLEIKPVSITKSIRGRTKGWNISILTDERSVNYFVDVKKNALMIESIVLNESSWVEKDTLIKKIFDKRPMSKAVAIAKKKEVTKKIKRNKNKKRKG